MNIVNWHKHNDMVPLKIGDYVRVRRDLSMEKTYGVEVVPNMLCLRGIVTRVSKVRRDGYELLGMIRDTRKYGWSKDMLQRVSKEEMAQNKAFIGCDRVRIIPNFKEVALKNDDIDYDDIDEMNEYAGRAAYITDINFYEGEIESYELNVDGADNWWPPRYLQRITDEEWQKENPDVMVPGTFVKIRKDLDVTKKYGLLPVHSEMAKLAGAKAFVEFIDTDKTYHLTGTCTDEFNFWWTPEMLERVE